MNLARLTAITTVIATALSLLLLAPNTPAPAATQRDCSTPSPRHGNNGDPSRPGPSWQAGSVQRPTSTPLYPGRTPTYPAESVYPGSTATIRDSTNRKNADTTAPAEENTDDTTPASAESSRPGADQATTMPETSAISDEQSPRATVRPNPAGRTRPVRPHLLRGRRIRGRASPRPRHRRRRRPPAPAMFST
jgi:hypothetical protein